MTTKAAKKYGEDAIKVPASSLLPCEKDGMLTKQGGSWKSWKQRYFVLKGDKLYYYKTPKDQVFTGRIELESNSVVREELGKKKQFLLSVKTQKRHFMMYADTPEDGKQWIAAIQKKT